jgi:S1-C subfamily serine protease
MEYMDEENFSQQELFQQEKYISDLIEKKSEKQRSSTNIMFASSLVSSAIVLSFLYLFGLFDDEEIAIPAPVTITETVTEKELVMPRVDSTEIVSIAELATKTIVQVQVGNTSEEGEFLPNGGGSGVVISGDGLIMTNHHVIDNSTEVRVVFEDGECMKVRLLDLIGSQILVC